jgi:hypothetical protein
MSFGGYLAQVRLPRSILTVREHTGPSGPTTSTVPSTSPLAAGGGPRPGRRPRVFVMARGMVTFSVVRADQAAGPSHHTESEP